MLADLSSGAQVGKEKFDTELAKAKGAFGAACGCKSAN